MMNLFFSINKGQSWMWGEEDGPAILPKTKGSGIMISDFVDEFDDYLSLTDDQFENAKKKNPVIQQGATRVRCRK